MSEEMFRQEILGEFMQPDIALYELGKEYHTRVTDSNWRQIKKEIFEKGRAMGYGSSEIQHSIFNFVKEV